MTPDFVYYLEKIFLFSVTLTKQFNIIKVLHIVLLK